MEASNPLSASRYFKKMDGIRLRDFVYSSNSTSLFECRDRGYLSIAILQGAHLNANGFKRKEIDILVFPSWL